MQRVSTFMVTRALGNDRLAEQARGPLRIGRWRGHGASLHSQRGRGATLHGQRGRGATLRGQRGHGATSQLARPADTRRAGSVISDSAGAALQLAGCCSGRRIIEWRGPGRGCSGRAPEVSTVILEGFIELCPPAYHLDSVSVM